jgi:hypothetical protein
MPCGCSGSTEDQWVIVFADNTVSAPMTKAQATEESQKKSGSWIRAASTVNA